MIIQNGSRPNVDAQTGGRASGDVSKVVAAPVASERSAAVDLPQVAAAPQVSAEQVRKAVADLNRAMQSSNRNLQFSVDADTKRVVVRITDMATGEVIRQIPSEEALSISRSIGEFQQGLLLKQQA